MRLVYFGSSPFGIPTLERLWREHDVAAVVTQPDRPSGRGGKVTPTPVAAWCAAHIPNGAVFKPEKVNASDVVASIRALHADAWVVIAYGQKLGRALLDGVFAINLHASLLPRWRGAAPINAAIMAGDVETGNCVITLADRMDAGDILGSTTRAIEPHHTAGDLHDLLASDGPDLVSSVLDGHARRSLSPRAQDESLVTIAPKLSAADGWIDFNAPAEHCRRRINGLSPTPAVTVRFREQPLKLLRAVVEPDDGEYAPGAIVDPAAGRIACAGRTVLRLLEVQPAGKRVMTWSEFANGRRPALGEQVLGGAPA